MALFISTQHCSPCRMYCSHGTVHLTACSLPRAVTLPDDTVADALHAQLKSIIKEAKDTEVQADVHVQAACLLLEEEESKATALEQMATAPCLRVPSSSSSSSSPDVAPHLVPTSSLTYEDTIVTGLHLQAASVLNVRQLVNIVLDSSTNYASWHDLMEQAL
jgi:hypothetical protein